MIKYTLVVEGMQCSMCESHVNDAVRKAFPVKKSPVFSQQGADHRDRGRAPG